VSATPELWFWITFRAGATQGHRTAIMNNRQGQHLDQWIMSVKAGDLPALHTFVTGLGQDLDAVVAGLSLRYSSGAVEGHNNKIKMLKRQMFGRANFDLLRKRVLLSARRRS
jgi:transposase